MSSEIAEKALEFVLGMQEDGFSKEDILRLMDDPQKSGIDFSQCKDDMKEMFDEVRFICESGIKTKKKYQAKNT